MWLVSLGWKGNESRESKLCLNTAVSQSMRPHAVQIYARVHLIVCGILGDGSTSFDFTHAARTLSQSSHHFYTSNDNFLIVQRRTFNRSVKYFFNWSILIPRNSLAASAILSTRKLENRPRDRGIDVGGARIVKRPYCEIFITAFYWSCNGYVIFAIDLLKSIIKK